MSDQALFMELKMIACLTFSALVLLPRWCVCVTDGSSASVYLAAIHIKSPRLGQLKFGRYKSNLGPSFSSNLTSHLSNSLLSVKRS
jgi:hypothetical protein